MIAAAAGKLSANIESLSARIGEPVRVDPRRVLNRKDSLALREPGAVSPNGSCRLLQSRDGWIAVNLAREEDRASLEAWCGADAGDGRDLGACVRRLQSAHLVEQARWLSMPVSAVGESAANREAPSLRRIAGGGAAPARLRVLDLSCLWAGPLCASIFMHMGADVLRIESESRPDRIGAPHYDRLNAGKTVVNLDLSSADGRAALAREMRKADVIVTSARFRVFEQWGLDPFQDDLLKPNAVWIAISGYGWIGENADRVAFGDDAAAAAGLVDWKDGAPRFAGDATADPLTGLAAAAAGLEAILRGGGLLVDAPLASCAAYACGLREVAA